MAALKITTAAVKSAAEVANKGQAPKTGPSAFDSIRSQLAGEAGQETKLPPLASPTPQQISAIDKTLQKQLERTKAGSAADFFASQVSSTRSSIDKVTQAVDKIAPQNSTSPIRDRLNTIEQQFQKTGALIQRVNGMDPKSLLNIQVQLYQLSENVELLSKAADSLTSGAKTVMQTAV